ncbi:MAG: hypothetical protein LQ338_002171 [Usnochroma carphineum]|nr:MAG: hypothetical protein LQ338_002171 [Usnochroma carphineum]
MAARNPDAVANQGEFQAHRPREEPLTTHGHKPGVLLGNDTAPEFTAKTLPPGSAPTDRTFQPNNISEVPSQALNPDVLPSHGKESTHTTASSTLGGATSGDVHKGLGKPVQGQTSSELHGGKAGSGREGGLAGVGASGAASGAKMADERVQVHQRGLEREGGKFAGTKSDKTEVGAEELPNESA